MPDSVRDSDSTCYLNAMAAPEFREKTTTADGTELELAVEHGNHVVRVDGVPLMASGLSGSEEAMAPIALEELGAVRAPRILIGGLGMGYTLRSVLDTFDETAEVCVAELLPQMVLWNRGPLAHLAEHPLEDPRVEVRVGDVRDVLEDGDWDVVLLDVDNGPDALTAKKNRSLYNQRGAERMAHSLAEGGVLIVWSAYPSRQFHERLEKTGLTVRSMTVHAGWPERVGPKHTLFVALG